MLIGGRAPQVGFVTARRPRGSELAPRGLADSRRSDRGEALTPVDAEAVLGALAGRSTRRRGDPGRRRHWLRLLFHQAVADRRERADRTLALERQVELLADVADMGLQEVGIPAFVPPGVVDQAGVRNDLPLI